MRRPIHLAAALAATFACLAFAPPAARADDDRVRVIGVGRNGARVLVDDDGDRTIVLNGGLRGYLGVHVVELTPELLRHFRAGEEGVLVSKVVADSPAAAAGILVGDVLVAVAGEPVRGAATLRRIVGPREQGDEIGIELIRDGRVLEVTAHVEARQGRVLELGQLMRPGMDGRPLMVMPSDEEWEEFGHQFEAYGKQFEDLGEHISEAMEQAFENPEVRWRIDRELRQREELERQIETLEKRLQELERRLEDGRR